MLTLQAKDIYLKGTKGAVLLLHSFTSTANEMRSLSQYLHSEGYTCLAVNYKGHAATPEVLFQSSVGDAWDTAVDALAFLQQEGYDEVTIIGQSLGGVIALRLAEHPLCQALVVISSPIEERPLEELQMRVQAYAKRYYRFQQQSEEWVEAFIATHFPRLNDNYVALQQFIVQTKTYVQAITKPIFLAKGALDDDVFQHSIDYIAQNVLNAQVVMHLYEKSGHLITLGRERELLQQHLGQFLQMIHEHKAHLTG